MNTETMQMWQHMNEMGRSTLESWLKLSEITMRGAQRMMELQLTITGGCLESATNYMKEMSEAKDLPGMLVVPTRIASACAEKWMANAGKVLEISQQAQSELGQWMSDSINRASSQAGQITAMSRQAVPQAA
jgi:phasin family protein